MNIIAIERQTLLDVKHKVSKALIQAYLSHRSTFNCETLEIEVKSTDLHKFIVILPHDG